MEQKDYYRVLGVDKKADPARIKEAYRKLALKYHPDRNRENPEAAARMKEINESYAVLSDPRKKTQYGISIRHVVEEVHQRGEMSVHKYIPF